MVLETVATLFLVTRKDVKTPLRLKSESNDHTYGCYMRVQHEFNLAQLCGIEEKRRNYNDAVFKGGLKTCRSKRELKRYQQKFDDYVESATKSSTNDVRGPVGVDYEKTAVNKLWSEVSHGTVTMDST